MSSESGSPVNLDRGRLPRAETRSSGVGKKLRNAFIGVALFSLLAAAVGTVSFHFIERSQDQVLDRSVPAMLNAERLAKQVLATIAATPALLTAADESSITLERELAEATERRARAVLTRLGELGIVTEQREPIKQQLDEIFGNLRRQTELVSHRVSLSSRLQQAQQQAGEIASDMARKLGTAIIDASTRLLDDSDEVRETMTAQRPDRQMVLEQFDNLTEVDFFALERLTEMRFRTESLREYVERLLLTNEQEGIAQLRDDVTLLLRALARSALEFEDALLRVEVARALQEFIDLAQGPQNLFELRSEVVEIEREIGVISKANRIKGGELQLRVDQLLSDVDLEIKAATAAARQVVLWGQIALLLIALIAFAAAIFLTWRYVLKDIAERIRRLTVVTRDLAEGNLEVVVDVEGNDELGDMADAVRVFKANATELRRSNADLEQFAYVASHDLKSPLRGISNLAGWIEEDLQETISDESRQHLTLLKGRISRLNNLLEDLLQYSRSGRQQAEIQSVELDNLVPEVFRLVAPEQQFDLRLAPSLPSLQTAQAPLEQVLRNLISNSVKHHDRDRGLIEVSVTDLGDYLEFSVGDDGPGVPEQYQKRIFGLFQTLKGRDEVEGSGMGLAIIKRLIESIGGSITIDSTPDAERGSRFRFTWPKRWPKSLTAGLAD